MSKSNHHFLISVISVTLLNMIFMLSVFSKNALAITCEDLDRAYVFSQESTPVYLGFFGSQFSSDSIMNEYGTYGSPYSSLSVRNEYGTYGSPYSMYSANNDYTTTPPKIYKYGVLIAYLTTNSLINGGVSLAAIDLNCNFYSSSPETGSPPPPPSPPSSISASDGTYTDKISLTWSTVTGATSYNVYYAESLSGTKNFIHSTTTTSMDLIGSTPEYVYYFWVSASNLWGEGNLSVPDSGYMAGSAIYYAISVSKSGSGSGTISSNPPGISCDSDCSENYISGSSITLSAIANSPYTATWKDCTEQGGVVSGNNTSIAKCTFSNLDSNKTVTANFGITCFQDFDQDNYGSNIIINDDGDGVCETADGESIVNTDCNDTNAAINPGATESCDGLDNNCNGTIDDGLAITLWYPDGDGDGYGNLAGPTLDQCGKPAGYVADTTDCNDANALERPGQTWYKDADGDGYSDGTTIVACARPANCFVASELKATSGDPDDTDPNKIPDDFAWELFLPAIINNKHP